MKSLREGIGRVEFLGPDIEDNDSGVKGGELG
jgi:hypothetical protein